MRVGGPFKKTHINIEIAKFAYAMNMTSETDHLQSFLGVQCSIKLLGKQNSTKHLSLFQKTCPRENLATIAVVGTGGLIPMLGEPLSGFLQQLSKVEDLNSLGI